MSKYVKLKDKGAVFFDPLQQVKVSGTLPFKVEATKKVELALKNGILLEVSKEEALKMLDKEKDRLESIENAKKNIISPKKKTGEEKVSKLLTDLEESKNSEKLLKEENEFLVKSLKEANEKLEALEKTTSEKSKDETSKEGKDKGKPTPDPKA